MNVHMTRAEFEALPFRDDVTGDYEYGKRYRAKGDAYGVYDYRGSPNHPDYPIWWSFSVRFEPDPDDEEYT